MAAPRRAAPGGDFADWSPASVFGDTQAARPAPMAKPRRAAKSVKAQDEALEAAWKGRSSDRGEGLMSALSAINTVLEAGVDEPREEAGASSWQNLRNRKPEQDPRRRRSTNARRRAPPAPPPPKRRSTNPAAPRRRSSAQVAAGLMAAKRAPRGTEAWAARVVQLRWRVYSLAKREARAKNRAAKMQAMLRAMAATALAATWRRRCVVWRAGSWRPGLCRRITAETSLASGI